MFRLGSLFLLVFLCSLPQANALNHFPDENGADKKSDDDRKKNEDWKKDRKLFTVDDTWYAWNFKENTLQIYNSETKSWEMLVEKMDMPQISTRNTKIQDGAKMVPYILSKPKLLKDGKTQLKVTLGIEVILSQTPTSKSFYTQAWLPYPKSVQEEGENPPKGEWY